MTQLPPEDQRPTFRPLEPGEAEGGLGPNDQSNPVAVGAWFLNAATAPGGPDLRALRAIVTPESLPLWGDFQKIREVLDDCGITSMADPAVGDPDVVYVKYPASPAESFVSEQDTVMALRAIGTLVRRPSLGGWRVHALGQYVRPEHVPHD